MSTPTYTYANCDGSNLPNDFVRLLIPDTGGNPNLPNNGFVFSDQEITAFQSINQLQGWQSGMFWSFYGGRYIPTYPSNYYRAAAVALNALAGNQARLLAIASLLDVKLQNVQQVVAALQATAQRYLDMDDNSGAFAIAEQVQTSWNFIDRYWSQVQRQSGGWTG
jgi:hypothetical protein